MKFQKLKLERLEQRIAPGSICCDGGSKDDGCDDGSKEKQKGNNGYGNGGDDGSNADKQDENR